MKRNALHLVLALSGSALLAGSARADRRNPLEGQPAIRHRVELRTLRFEVTPFVGFTMLQDFNNTVFGGVKLQYHLNDWFSIGGLFGGGAAIGTGLKDQILTTLPDMGSASVPSKTCAEAAMNKIVWYAAGQGEFTPFAGKFSLFSKSFFNYDFYVDGGVGFIGLQNDSGKLSGCGDQFGKNDGMKIGPSGAVGVHMFFNKFIALNLEYRGIVAKDNSAGRDTNGDKVLNDDDQKLGLKSFVTLGVAFFLPTTAEISR
jgi:outer membrane beta-barrel protein